MSAPNTESSTNVSSLGNNEAGTVLYGNVTINGTTVISSDAPTAANAAGTAGTITWDATHLYVCVAADTWVRANVATF